MGKYKNKVLLVVKRQQTETCKTCINRLLHLLCSSHRIQDFCLLESHAAPLGIISYVTSLYLVVSRAHLGKRTLSLPRLLCSVDVVLVVTFPPFCSDRVLLFLLTLLTGAATPSKHPQGKNLTEDHLLKHSILPNKGKILEETG